MTVPFVDIVEQMRALAEARPTAAAFSFVGDDGTVVSQLTRRDLVDAVDGIAGLLLGRAGLAPGDRAVLVYPPSMEFITGFVGCLSAGVVPVPVYPPNPFDLAHDLGALRRVVRDCDARVALTCKRYSRGSRLGSMRSLLTGERARWPTGLRWFDTDRVRSGRFDPSSRGPVQASDVALLQYTSGSTSVPKGVMITHGNIVHQLAYNRSALGLRDDAVAVMWVPQYHDFGLISGILSALIGNGHLVVFSPLAFIKRPALWFELMSRHGATHTAAPNFAYELAVRRTSREERASWDLSRLEVVMSAAEPVRSATVERFLEAFEVAGLRREAFCPAYGLAEHTVGVSVGGRAVRRLDRVSLERDHRVVPASGQDDTTRAVTLLGCGRPPEDVEVVVVDPGSKVPCAAGEVGEIWVDSPSKAAGYWQLPELSEEVFRARIEGNERRFLRTGDLGFVDQASGEVFICGRLKDVLILAGRNIYPQDVELDVEGCHEAVRPGNVACFQHEVDAEEQLVVVAELRASGAPVEEVVDAIRRTVSARHRLPCHEIVLVEARSIAKTTSGKIQRSRCRERWLEGDLRVVHRAGRPGGQDVQAPLRILVVGGGAAGLSAARELQRRGYHDLTVVEGQAALGGKVRSLEHRGIAQELGQTFFGPLYRRCSSLAAELGIELRTERKAYAVCDVRTGTCRPAEAVESLAWTRRVLQRARQDDSEDRWRLTAKDWLAQHGMPPAPELVRNLWTHYGYGRLSDDVAAHHLLDYLATVVSSTGEVARVPGGNQRLWRELGRRLGRAGARVCCGTKVTAVHTTAERSLRIEVEGHPELQAERFDRVVFALPPSQLSRILPPSERRDLLERFRTYDYVTTLIEAPGLPAGGEVRVDRPLEEDAPGCLLGWLRSEGSDLVVAAQYRSLGAAEPLSDEELTACLRRDLGAIGASLGEVVTRRSWSYFPHVPLSGDAAGVRRRLEELQGQDGMLLVGSYLCHETVEHVVRHAQDRVREHFALLEGQLAAPSLEEGPIAAPAPAASAGEETTLEVVREEIARVLGLPGTASVPANRPLQELGLSSVMAVELADRLGGRLGVDLPATLAFDAPTPALLAAFIDAEGARERDPGSSGAALQEPIAVVGVGCRFPGGVRTPEALWCLLRDGVDAITEVPGDRWDVDAFFDPDPTAVGKMSSRWGGFLDGVDAFDARFFGISPREASCIDPQQRLLLECTWEALERAGFRPAELVGSNTGVFVGLTGHDYQALSMHDAEAIDAYSLLGTAHSAAAGRLSYTFGFEGPSLAVDTACSSSLVAIHQAAQALRAGECDLAVAGGVNLVLAPHVSVYFTRLGALSPTGRCRAFSADADGMVRSEGCGVVVLKPMSAAVRDGDPILGVIRGTAVNQDGVSQGLAAPNGMAQRRAIDAALQRTGVGPRAIDYVECHGTGTPLGDPIEVLSLGATLGRDRAGADRLLVGSIKSNLGHTEAAAGVAGLIKVLLCLQHGHLPPTLHAETLNPRIAWAEAGVEPVRVGRDWPAREGPRRAGVSSFGFAGTNAHVVLEEAPSRPVSASVPVGRGALVTLSARDTGAMAQQAAALCAFLDAGPDVDLQQLAYTLGAARQRHEHTLALAVPDVSALRAALRQVAEGELGAPVGSGGTHGTGDAGGPIAFVFPGQGSQWAGMGRELLVDEPVFREALGRCDAAIAKEAGFSVIEQLAGDLEGIEHVQPVLFSMQVALAALWRSWGVEPDAVIGHSMGEVAAAVVAGVLSLRDGAAVVCRRSRLLSTLSGRGAMALVELGRAEAEAAIREHPGRLSVAACNSSRATVLAGEPAALERVLDGLSARGVFTRRIRVDVASHCSQVDPLEPRLLAALADLSPGDAAVSLWSTVTGEKVVGGELHAGYWWRNLREPVELATAVRRQLELEPSTRFVEISPHPLLVPSVRDLAHERQVRPAVVGTLERGQPERRALLGALGRLVALGVEPAWAAVCGTSEPLSQLPTYPFQRSSYWRSSARRVLAAQAGGHGVGQSFEVLTQAARRASERCPAELDLERALSRNRSLEEIRAALVAAVLAELGIVGGADRSLKERERLCDRAGVVASFRPLVAGWMRDFEPDGAADPGALVREADLPVPLAEMLGQARAFLPPILRGDLDAASLLFPDGRFDRVDYLHRAHPPSRYFNDVVADVIERVVSRSRARPRILEIGGGTGGTTSAVVPRLHGDQVDYVFTDVAELFLGRARRAFGGAVGLQTRLLDIDDAPGTSAPDLVGRCDVVLASHALHVAADITSAVHHAAAFLKPGGLLVLLELVERNPLIDVTFGLLDAWRDVDDGVRHGSLLLNAECWRELLTAAGLEVASVPAEDSRFARLGQRVILAHKPARDPTVTAPSLAMTPVNHPESEGLEDSSGSRRELVAALRGGPQDRARLVRALLVFVSARLAAIAGIRPGDVGPGVRLRELGVDSLMMLDLRAQLEEVVGQRIAAATLWRAAALGEVCERLADDLAGVPGQSGSRPLPQLGALLELRSCEDVDDAGLGAGVRRLEAVFAGCRLSCLEVGEGPPVVLLSPLFAPPGIWRHQLPALAGCRLLVPLYPGQGATSAGLADLSTLAEAIAAVVERASGEEAVRLVGWSFGGLLALQVARRLPDRVAGQLLINTVARLGVEAADRSEELAEVFGALDHEVDALGEEAALLRSGNDGRSLEIALLESARGLDLRPAIEAMRMPVVVVAGRADRMVVPEHSRVLASCFADAAFELFEGGHLLPWTHPERLNALLARFGA